MNDEYLDGIMMKAEIAKLQRQLADKSAECKRLRDAIEHVLSASEDGGDMSDIDWQMLRAALQEAQP